MGRPRKLDDLREKRILDALRDGHSFAAAARAGGVDETTLHDWRRRGLEGEGDFLRFSQRVEEAQQVAEDRCIQVIKSALTGQDLKLATDAAWKWLARRRPAEWGEPKVLVPDVNVTTDASNAGADLVVVESVLAAIKSRKQVA